MFKSGRHAGICNTQVTPKSWSRSCDNPHPTPRLVIASFKDLLDDDLGALQRRVRAHTDISDSHYGRQGPIVEMHTSEAATRTLRAARPILKQAQQKRNLQDVAITRTGKPIIRSQGGRSSLGGNTATVFGANGFLGRYIVQRLARTGCQVVIPYREEMAKRHLKLTGDLGRITYTEFDLRNTQSIEESVRHSDIVINMIGRNYPTKNFSLFDVNVEGVERIAEAVAKYDVDRFIHMSSYNADENSPSEFFKTKVRCIGSFYDTG